MGRGVHISTEFAFLLSGVFIMLVAWALNLLGTRNDTARAREVSVAGGAKAGLKYSRTRAYRATAEALIQIRGARETNQSSTMSVRSSRRTSPSSANARATRMRDISRQTTRARIIVCKGCKEEKVSRRREVVHAPIFPGKKGARAIRETFLEARKKTLYRRPDGRDAGVAKLGQRRRT